MLVEFQAKMMIALIESCVERKKLARKGIPALDDVDGMTGENGKILFICY